MRFAGPCFGRSMVAVGVVGALLVAPVLGQNRAPSRIDPKADEVFSAMSARLAQARQFSFQSESMIDRVLDSGLRVQYGRTTRIVVRRPDALAFSAKGDVEDMAYWYANGKLALLDKRKNAYAQVDVPGNIDAMLDHVATRHGLVMPLCDLLFSDPRKACLEPVYAGVYVGLHEVAGAPCHHLAFRQDGVDWQIWIADGADPLPRKVVITYKDLPDSPQFVALLDQWNLADEQPAQAFEFVPPDGATRIDLPAAEQPQPNQMPKPAGG